MDIVSRWPGSTHDATIFRNSRICSRFESNEFEDAVIVADSGYPCNRFVMTPLSRVTTQAESLFNESIIRTRNCVERQYGVWKNRFPVLSLGIRMDVKQVEAIIVATAVLHNICNLCNDNEPPILSREIIASIDAAMNVPISEITSNNMSHRRNIIENHFRNL